MFRQFDNVQQNTGNQKRHNNFLRYYVFLALFISIWSFFPKHSYATISQEISNATSTSFANTGSTYQRLGNNLSGTLDTIRLKYNITANTLSETMDFGICGVSSPTSTCSNKGSSNGYIFDVQLPSSSVGFHDETIASSSGSFYYLNGASPTSTFTFDPALYYFISFDRNGGVGTLTLNLLGSTSSNAYRSATYDYQDGAESLKDIYFIINGATSSDDFLTFTFPTQSSTVSDVTDANGNSTFGNQYASSTNGYWVLNSTTTLSEGCIYVFYDNNPSFTNYVQNGLCGSNSFINGQVLIPKTQLLPIGTWYAQAFLTENVNINVTTSTVTVYATTALLNFNVGTSSVVSNPAFEAEGVCGTASSTFTSCQSSDSSFLGDIKEGVCVVLVCTFVPNSFTLQQFANLRDDISTRAPFGYVTIARNAFSGINSSTIAETSTLVVQNYTASLSGLFTLPRVAIGIIIWLLFGFWVIRRFYHVNP